MNIVWIDDDWVVETEKPRLEALQQKVNEKLLKEQIVIEWDCYANSSTAYTRIDQKSSQIDFIIVDLQFLDNQGNNQEVDATDLISKMSQMKIHFVIFSNYTKSIKTNSRYCVGKFEKNPDGEEHLVDCISLFFTFPPIRILQISDFHYDLRMNEQDRNDLLRSFEETVFSIHNNRKIDLVAIAGDIVATRPAEEINLVGDSLKKILLTSINLNEERVFIVPGNHEIIWSDFTDKILHSYPYSGFSTFLNTFYSKAILKTFTGFKSDSLPMDVTSDGLTWFKQLPIPCISIIGICSNSDKEEEQGIGILSQENIDFIRKKWGNTKKAPSELRILIMHHNIFPVQSFNSRDEGRTLINAGIAINTLSEFKCDIVLSGHTHRPESVLYQSSSLSGSGYEHNKTLMLISSGTSGGGDTNK